MDVQSGESEVEEVMGEGYTRSAPMTWSCT